MTNLGNLSKQRRARFRRRRKRGGDGFNHRQFAAALNPELLAKLHTPRPLATGKRGESDGSKP